MSKWLNAQYAARVLLSDITFPTPTVRLTELGSLISARLRLLLTELILPLPFALAAFVQARLSAHKAKKNSAKIAGFFCFILLFGTFCF